MYNIMLIISSAAESVSTPSAALPFPLASEQVLGKGIQSFRGQKKIANTSASYIFTTREWHLFMAQPAPGQEDVWCEIWPGKRSDAEADPENKPS